MAASLAARARGAAIWVDGGEQADGLGGGNNVSVLAGGTVDGSASGTAIQYTGNGILNVDNDGTVIGDVDLENDLGQLGTFTNNSANSYYAHQTVAADVVNTGRFVTASPAGFQYVTVTGNFTQTATGVLEMNVDFQKNQGDLLHVQGDADLDGTLAVHARNPMPRAVPVLQVDGARTGRLAVTDDVRGPLIAYEIEVNGTRWLLRPVADMVPDGFALQRNPAAVAAHLQTLWDTGSGRSFSKLFDTLNRVSALGGQQAYSEALAQLSPGAALGMGAYRTLGLLNFGDQMLSGTRYRDKTVYLDQRTSLWLYATGNTTLHTDGGGLPDFRLNTYTGQLGGQFELADGFFLGAAVAGETSRVHSDDGRVSADGYGLLGSLFLRKNWGPWQVAAIAFGSGSRYDVDRELDLLGSPMTAHSSPNVYGVGGLLRAGYTFGSEQHVYLRPTVSAGLISVYSPAYSEHDGGAMNLAVESADLLSFVLTPRVEAGGRIDLKEDLILTPFVAGGVTYLSNDEWSQSARLRAAPVNIGDFTTTIPMDHFLGRAEAGCRLEVGENITVQVQYEGLYSNHTLSHGVSMSFGWQF